MHIEARLAASPGRVSCEIVQQFANVARRKFADTASPAECKPFIEAAMQPMNRVASNIELLFRAIDMQYELRYHFNPFIDAVQVAPLPEAAPRM